jgi:hypothetical protein
MTGNALSNALIGSDGTDILSGAGGNDVLRGGAGADTLNGGSGADYFSYLSVSDGTALAADTIQDFQAGTDLISLRLIDADGNCVNGDTAFIFLGTGAFTGTAGHDRAAGLELPALAPDGRGAPPGAPVVLSASATPASTCRAMPLGPLHSGQAAPFHFGQEITKYLGSRHSGIILLFS